MPRKIHPAKNARITAGWASLAGCIAVSIVVFDDATVATDLSTTDLFMPTTTVPQTTPPAIKLEGPATAPPPKTDAVIVTEPEQVQPIETLEPEQVEPVVAVSDAS